MKPLLKWPGSKRRVADDLAARISPSLGKDGRYVELFAGSAAVFFALEPKNAVLVDVCKPLMSFYEAIQRQPDSVYDSLETLLALPNTEETYLSVRKDWNPKDYGPSFAAKLMYLNRTCFAPGSLVLFGDERLVPIEDVRIGDKLWNGRIVNEVLSRNYCGTVRIIKSGGSATSVTVTADHPMLMVPGRLESQKHDPRSAEVLAASIKLSPASDLREGDYVLLPTTGDSAEVDFDKFWPSDDDVGPQARDVKFDWRSNVPGLYRLLGYYAADGYIQYANGRPRSVGITIPTENAKSTTKKSEIIHDIFSIVESIWGIVPSDRVDGNQHEMNICSCRVAKFMSSVITGQTASQDVRLRKTKNIVNCLMTAPVEHQEQLLIGWLRGDGSLKRNTKNNSCEISGSGTVFKLCWQMFRIAQRCGLRPSWRVTRPNGGDEEYFVYFGYSKEVARLGFDVLIPKRKEINRRKFIGGYLAVPVNSITDLEYCGTVHNLEVDGDHLLCVGGIVSHNCFNGLFRLNKDGFFNVAWGKHKTLPGFPSREEIGAASVLLSNTTLHSKDYSNVLRATHKGDCVYADPPYWGKYDRYAGGSFSEEDQQQLSEGLFRALQRGVNVFASNLDCEQVRNAYGTWAPISIIPVLHKIGCTADSRKTVNEVFIAGRAPFVDPRQLSLF